MALLRFQGFSGFGGSPRRGGIAWRPYDGVPGIAAFSSGSFVPSADWYRSFLYLRERERGLDCLEDLAAPGVFEIPLEAGTGTLILTAETARLLQLGAIPRPFGCR